MKTKITVHGFGLNRAIFIDGEYLDPTPSQKLAEYTSNGFDWGYESAASTQLALAILLETRDRETALKHVASFRDIIVALIPTGNFRVVIKLDKLLQAMEPYPQREKKISAYSFMDVCVLSDSDKTVRIKKFLDFPSMGFETAEFLPDTIEYNLLNDLSEEDFDALKEYCTIKTVRPSIENKKLKISMIIEFDKLNNCYSVRRNLGTGHYIGHNKYDYEY